MRLQIRHLTRYRYEHPVVSSQHVAMLCPRDGFGQRRLSHTLQIDPAPAQRHDDIDAYGNRRTHFAIAQPHTELDVLAESMVETQPPAQPTDDQPWEALQRQLQRGADATSRVLQPYTMASPHVGPDALGDPELRAYTLQSLVPGGGWLDGCRDLATRLHRDWTYAPGSTRVDTPPLQAFRQRAGVCQDYAHVMIAALRALGLPARYVSGYVWNEPPPGQPRLLGADASHAWVAVPHAGRWFHLDPTNHRWGWDRPDEGFVTLAFGRDYGDVSPLRGTLQGGGAHTLAVAVSVTAARP